MFQMNIYSIYNMVWNTMFSLPIFFVVALSSILHVSSNRGIIPCSNPEYVVTPQYNPVSATVFSNAPSVILFVNTFLEAVYSTDILREVCDLSQSSAKDYAEYVRQYTQIALSDLDVQNAAELAEWTSRAINLYFDVLPLPVVARTYANMCANFLYVDGYLEIDNAKELALAYAKEIADYARWNMNSDPSSKYESLVGGYGNFLLSLVPTTKQSATLITFYVGNEWFVAAVNSGLV